MATPEVTVTSGEYSYTPIERIHFGPGSISKLKTELDRIDSERPFIITGQTIAGKTRLVERAEQASGRKLAGVFSQIKQHAPVSGIRSAAKAAREVEADSLISLGGGSPIDATKIVVKELSEDFRTNPIPHIAVPTTLSAAEFSPSAGMTNEERKIKTGVRDLRMVPRLIFLDPEMTLPTPGWLWASTGIRSLDHAVEAVLSPKHQPYVDTLALEAISILFHSLSMSIAEPVDLKPRLACQIAAWMSDAGVVSVGTGISHSIGRVIGAAWDIPHGITSCMTLPQVMRMQAKKDPHRLISIAEAEGLETRGLPEEIAISAANGVARLVDKLGLSKRLRDYGVQKTDFPRIAREAGSPEQTTEILQILEQIW